MQEKNQRYCDITKKEQRKDKQKDKEFVKRRRHPKKNRWTGDL